jgi:hypothetical protein
MTLLIIILVYLSGVVLSYLLGRWVRKQINDNKYTHEDRIVILLWSLLSHVFIIILCIVSSDIVFPNDKQAKW